MASSKTEISDAIDAAAIERWLGSAASIEAPLEFSLISGGRSNLTVEIREANGRSRVLRRPPMGRHASTAHDVGREFQIIQALAPTAIPVPPPVAYCADPEVTGAPFFVMEFAGGETIADPAAAALLSGPARVRLGEAAVEVLADLHALDPEAIGLGELIRPGAYIERQLRRWGRQLDTYSSLTTPWIRRIETALAERMPTQQRSSIAHGDYKLANLRADGMGEVTAVLDWELTAVGDPLADLGWLLASWAQPDEGGTWITPPPTLAGGFADAATLVERYAERSGLDTSEVDYYVAFSQWRWSCINEGHLARIARASMIDTSVDPVDVRGQIEWQLADAARRLGL